MALLTIDYTTAIDEHDQTEDWNGTEGNAADSNPGTEAASDAIPLAMMSSYLTGTVHNNTRSAGVITKVEIGANVAHADIIMRSWFYPIFNGANGTGGLVTGAPGTIWLDVTSDGAGPGAANWTWTDVNTLDCRTRYQAWWDNNFNAEVVQLYARVTYDSFPETYINIGDSWRPVIAIQINIGDAWEDVDDIDINIGDVWKDTE